MSSKYLLARPLSGIFLQEPGQRLYIHAVILLIFDLVQQPLQFLAFQYRRRRFDVYLCLFPGAGENHQMLHLDIVNFILGENPAYRIDSLFPFRQWVWEIDLSVSTVYPAPFFILLLPIISRTGRFLTKDG